MPVTLGATRTTSLFDDQDSDGKVDLGDTLFIRLDVSNTGDTDAQNAVINDALTGQTLVAGSINISPLAVNDVFNAVGNTEFLVGGAAGSGGPAAVFAGNLLTNDSNLAGDNFPGFTLTSTGAFVTSGSGSVTINADGSFAYNPAAGFTGADTFTYTLRDAGQDGIAGNSDDLTSTATVTINVANTVWYVDTNAGVNGDGTSDNPFNTIASVNGAGGAGDADGANHIIYVEGNATANIVLETGQSLIGTGVALVVGGYTLASAGSANTLSHGTGTGVLLATNNTLSGFTITGTDFTGVGIADNNGTVGNLTISSVAVTGRGQIIDVDQGGALNVTFSSVTSTSSSGVGGVIDLDGVAAGTALTGTFTVNGFTTMDNGTGTHNQVGISIGGNNTNLVANFAGGTSLNMGPNASAAGIDLGANSGSTNFAGLAIATQTANGFVANNAGTLTITGAGNSVTTTTGQILSITNTLVGATDVNFNILSSSGITTGNAISLSNVDNNDVVISNVSIAGSNADGINVSGGSSTNVAINTATINNTTGDGIELNGHTGSFSIVTGNIGNTNDPAGDTVNITGGTGAVDIDANLFKSSGGNVVEVNGHTTGTINFGGNITASGGGNNGILLNNNSGNIDFSGASKVINTATNNGVTITNNTANVSFTGGGLDIDTTSGAGISAGTTSTATAGTLVITGSGNSVTTDTGHAIVINGTTIGGSGVTLQSVGVTNGTSNTGIFLNNAGSGGFTITGTGTTAGSGGTINSIDSGSDGNVAQGIGIYINNTNNISLSNMAFTGDFANFGIRGVNVNNFTLRDSTANSASADNGGFGNSNAADEGVISFDNLTGTALFTGNNLSDGHEDIIVIENTSGTLNLTVNDSAANQAVIGRNGESVGTATGNDGILVVTSGSAALTMTVTGVVFEGWRGDGIQVDARGTSTQNITISNNTFHNAHLDITSGGGGAVFLGLSAGTGAGPNVTYAITGNSIRGAEGSAIVASAIGPSGAMSGTILNNTIGLNNGVHSAAQASTGSNQGGHGIFVRAEKDGTGGTLTHAVRIENNDIGDITTGAGIFLLANGDGAAGAGTSRLEATIINNRIDELGVNAYAGINATVGGAGGADDALMGINFESNNINMSGATNAVAGIIFDDLASTAAFYFPGYNGPYDDPGLTAFHTGAEGNTINVAGTFASQVLTSPTGTIGFNGAFVLPVPLLASAPPVDDWEAAIRAQQEQAQAEYEASAAKPGEGTGGDFIPPPPAPDGGEPAEADPVTGSGPISDDGILTPAELAFLVEAAIQRWIAAGASEEQVAAMRATSISVTDLGGLYIGTSSPGVIVLDDNAAGHNWYLDATPEADEEYSLQNGELRADPNTTAGNRVDLLTAIMHELGHQIGLEDEYDSADAGDLMYGFINPGERHLPGEEEVASATGTPVDYTALALGAVAFGTIQAGTTRQISWQTTYDGPGTNQVVPDVGNTSTVTYNNGGGDIVVNSNTNTLGAATSPLAVDTLALGGVIWNDNGAGGGGDADGTRGGTEPGISGVALTLFADTNGDNVWDAGDTQIATTTSGVGGVYSFTGLAPGNYIVRVDLSNFSGLGALTGTPISSVTVPEPGDPDDDVQNDDNGARASGDAGYSNAITLSYGGEPITDGDIDPDTNLTLDFGFYFDDPGTPGNDAETVAENATVDVAVLGNDTDSDGPTPSVAEVNGAAIAEGATVTLPSGAQVTRNANGTLTYDPNGAFDATPTGDSGASNTPGGDSFTYTLAGGGTATVTMTITGVDTDDLLLDTGANDTLFGGAGNDTYVVTNNGDTVWELPGNGIDTIRTDIVTYVLRAANVENLTGTNSAGQMLRANNLDNRITGDIGADTMVGLLGNDTYVVRNQSDTIVEAVGEGTDTVETDLAAYILNAANVENLTGTSLSAQQLKGNALDNRIMGGLANDTLIGGLGNDTYVLLNAGDSIVEAAGEGTDTVETALAVYVLRAANVENLTGTSNAGQVLIGDGGANRIAGGTGNDTLAGRGGDDTYVLLNNGDTIVEEAAGGTDTIETALSYYVINAANVENLTYTGGGNFAGIGNGGDNVITGGTGNDFLNGGLGADTLIGGAGNDFYLFDSALGGGNVDTLPGFVSGSDRILLEDAIFTALAVGGIPAGAFVLGTAAADADDRIIYDQASGALYYDADGNGAGAAIQFATLDPGTTLAFTDFTVL